MRNSSLLKVIITANDSRNIFSYSKSIRGKERRMEEGTSSVEEAVASRDRDIDVFLSVPVCVKKHQLSVVNNCKHTWFEK